MVDLVNNFGSSEKNDKQWWLVSAGVTMGERSSTCIDAFSSRKWASNAVHLLLKLPRVPDAVHALINLLVFLTNFQGMITRLKFGTTSYTGVFSLFLDT